MKAKKIRCFLSSHSEVSSTLRTFSYTHWHKEDILFRQLVHVDYLTDIVRSLTSEKQSLVQLTHTGNTARFLSIAKMSTRFCCFLLQALADTKTMEYIRGGFYDVIRICLSIAEVSRKNGGPGKIVQFLFGYFLLQLIALNTWHGFSTINYILERKMKTYSFVLVRVSFLDLAA